ncbi:uncharacterized protein METZ01_LOCUS500168, partial [marine metagenome]
MTSLPGDEEVDQEATAEEEIEAPESTGDPNGDNQDDLAAEWNTMVGDEEGNEKVASPEDASDASRVLNQDEIDSLLGLSEVNEGGTDQTGLNTILNSG